MCTDMWKQYERMRVETVWGRTLTLILHRNIDQTLVNSLHSLLNFEIGDLDCHVLTRKYITHVH